MDLIITLGIVGAFMTILGIGGLIADFVLPHIERLTKWLETLPLMQEEAKK